MRYEGSIILEATVRYEEESESPLRAARSRSLSTLVSANEWENGRRASGSTKSFTFVVLLLESR